MAVLKRASGVSYAYGGKEHSGWLPPGVATPLPTPLRHVTLDVTLEDDGGAGYLLVFVAREDPKFGNDYWFNDHDAAEAAAEEWFGIGPDRWQDTGCHAFSVTRAAIDAACKVLAGPNPRHPEELRPESWAMTVLVTDLETAARLRAEREATDGSKHDEVWNGVYVMSPLPDFEHQDIASELWLVFRAVLATIGGGKAQNGLNVSDREEGWVQNYREPDVGVVLPSNPAKNCGNHWCGGPDLLVEILSTNDLAREKRAFYAEIGVRELLIVDRDPWALELYRLDAGELNLVGTSTLDRSDALVSAVLPLSFRLIPGQERPLIEVSRTDGAETWRV